MRKFKKKSYKQVVKETNQRPKDIWIDGFEANVSQRVGSGQVAIEILRNIERLDRKNNYTILLASDPLGDLPKEREGFKYRRIYPNRFKTWVGIPALLYSAKQRPDVFFSPTHYLPRFIPDKIKKVMMVFDLAFIHFEDTFTKRDYLQLKNWTGFSVKKADQIVTISHASKKDIISLYQTEAKKITVAYPGYDSSSFKPIKDTQKIEETKLRYGIEGKYVVFLGTIQPRKNLLRLIEAFANIEDCKLVVIGKASGPGRQGWKYEEILNRPKELGIEDRVKFLGFVPTGDLPFLFSGAESYLLPSLWEGFGIPALEAMACGTPAIVSNVSSLPEVVGEAGLLVDPNSTAQIEQALRLVVNDKKVHQKLSERGLKQVKKFSWEKMAKEVIKVLENA